LEAGVAFCAAAFYISPRGEDAMASQNTKPYIKLAQSLVLVGGVLFGLERFGLDKIEGPNRAVHLDGTVLSILVLLPIVLIVAGALVFMVGKMRRL
jgi:hypothetical protein